MYVVVGKLNRQRCDVKALTTSRPGHVVKMFYQAPTVDSDCDFESTNAA